MRETRELIARLEKRVARLEAERGGTQPVQPAARVAAFVASQRVASPAAVAVQTQPARSVPPALPVAALAPMARVEQPRAQAGGQVSSGQRAGFRFEEMLAGKWYAVLGAIAVVIAVSLFVKLAYDQGWLRVAPMWRCIGAAMFGGGLVATAEWIRRRWGAWAAMGAASAGLGAVYASVFAAFKLYGLVSPAAGIVMMLVVAIAGTCVGVRLRLGVVVAVSLLGGFLSPVIMQGASTSAIALPAYVVTLLVIGLASCTWLEHKHAVKSMAGVRSLAVGGATILLSLWIFNSNVALWGWLCAIGVVWALVHAEAVINAMLAPQPAEASEDDRLPSELLVRVGSVSLATLAVTCWAVALSMHLVGSAQGTMWLPALFACAASGLLAGVLAPFGATISRLPATMRHALGQTMLVQSAVLLVVVIAAALGGYAQVAAFAGVGLAAAVMGPRLGSRGMRWYGLVLIAIATGRLLLEPVIGSFMGGAGAREFVIAGLVLSWERFAFVVMAAVWTVALALAADRTKVAETPAETKAIERRAVIRGVVPTALLLLVPMHTDAMATSILWAWIGLAAALWHARGLRCVNLPYAAVLVLGACVALWVPLAVGWMMDEAWFNASATHVALAGLVVAGAMTWLVMRERELVGDARTVLLWVSGVLALVASSIGVSAIVHQVFNVQTSTRGAVSVWWAVVAVGALAGGFKWSRAGLRYAGLALLGVAGAKVVIYDLAAVSAVWRIASFLLVGLLMMGVAFAYGKMARHTRETPVE